MNLNLSKKITLSIILSVLNSGCTTILDPLSADLQPAEIKLGTAEALIDKTVLGGMTVASNKNKTINVDDIDSVIAAISSGGTDSEKETLGALMIKASDEACYDYLTKISETEKTTRSILGASAVLLSGAASVTTPVRSANLLSGISTAAQGVEDELANSILGGQDGDLLVQAVRKGREVDRQKLANFLLGTQAGTGASTSGSFNRFLMEFPTYHDSCGISYGRQVLRDAVNASGTEND